MRCHKRKGAAVVEFAIIAPVLVMLILGMIEVGRFVNANQVVTNASREGARRASMADKNDTMAGTITREFLSNAGFSGSAAEVNVMRGGDSDNAYVVVEVTLPSESFRWVPVNMVQQSAHAATTMRCEQF